MTGPGSSAPSRSWNLRTGELRFGHLPALMGVVNVTPDSFSDGGRFVDVERALDHALRLEAEGATILDVGGESTRPGAEPVPLAEELRRVVPLIERLAPVAKTPISIDTQNAAVARAAIDAGAQIVNDVSGCLADPAMGSLVAELAVGVCAMHMRGVPATMQQDPRYDDVVREVADFLTQRRDVLVAAGVDRSRICLDPGIGFGKTTEHNLDLCRRVAELHRVGQPLLVGHSRKRFLGELIGDPTRDRDAATAGAAIAFALAGVQVLRVHDVARVRDALVSFDAMRLR
ncbi:MAG: dihydropteroate synthase [Lacipirellulaceae bacterium]